MSNNEFYIPQPPDIIFSHLNNEEESVGFNTTPVSVLKENPNALLIEKIEIEENKGIFIHYKDMQYPRRGFPFAHAVAQINVIKRVIIDTLSLISSKELILGYIGLLISPKRIENIDKALTIFCNLSYPLIKKYLVKPVLMTPFSSEFQGIVYGFLSNVGICASTSKKLAYIAGAIFEYDNAYRYRLEDIFSETTKDKLIESPIKETRRLFKIYLSREVHGRNYKYDKKRYVTDKFEVFYKLISLALLIPKIKESFKLAIKRSEFNRLQLDEVDIYWCKNREDYDFQGKSYKERMKDYKGSNGYIIEV